jgi:ferredoxin-NADP reductase
VLNEIAAACRLAGRVVAKRLFLDRTTETLLRAFDAPPSLRRIRARVIGIVRETAEVRTFVLRPNAHWRRHLAGQHLAVDVEIDGVCHRRFYSISSPPSGDARVLSVTIKRAAAGLVSRWLHDRVGAGDVLDLGRATGTFVLPGATPAGQDFLFLSAGSGITPVMSMIRELDLRGPVRDVVFLHYARTRDAVIFRRELQELAARHAGLRVVLKIADEPGGRFDESQVSQLVPDFARRATFLCGPTGLMARVERMWADAGATELLTRERFTLPGAYAQTQISLAPRRAPRRAPRTANLSLSRRRVTLTGERVLLEELESAGERPPHGCRMGLCHTCQCRKQTGTVRNVLTGAISSEPGEEIQLCVSVAQTDVELAL